MASSGTLPSVILLISVLFSLISYAVCDGIDWVSVNYIVQETRQSKSSGSTTEQALASIIRQADLLVGKGPWSITNEKSVLPPSQNPHDYLSWAPYHWPDCRWCPTKSKAQTTDDQTQANDQSPAADEDHGELSRRSKGEPLDRRSYYRPRRAARHRRRRVHHRRGNVDPVDSILKALNAEGGPGATTVTAHASNTNRLPSATASPAAPPSQAPPDAAKAAKTTSTCTPSPTTSMAPSATWTTCPYITKDGKVNPDVRTLKGPASINAVSQYALYGSIAYAAKAESKYSQGVANAIDTFFLNPDSKMNPNMNYGQVVRGPGPDGQKGTFTGILDLRGVVKIVNSIFVLKSGASADWTNARDQAMHNWFMEYIMWLEESDIGKVTASRPNNHVTFYVAQVAATKYYVGDKDGAAQVLRHFFNNEFRDQIAASGEQPFEGVRAKPVHYRCFNLEALIMIAKLGDALGVDFWTTKSKYGATIQTALDFVLASGPGDEGFGDVYPHVTAVAAAYGDPKGKYKAFLKKQLSTYETKPFWFYDQPSALTKAPTSSKAHAALLPVDGGDGDTAPSGPDDRDSDDDGPGEPDDDDDSDPAGSVPSAPKIPFTCPEAFKYTSKVEIDNGIFVTCEQLRPLYEADVPTGVVAQMI